MGFFPWPAESKIGSKGFVSLQGLQGFKFQVKMDLLFGFVSAHGLTIIVSNWLRTKISPDSLPSVLRPWKQQITAKHPQEQE